MKCDECQAEGYIEFELESTPVKVVCKYCNGFGTFRGPIELTNNDIGRKAKLNYPSSKLNLMNEYNGGYNPYHAQLAHNGVVGTISKVYKTSERHDGIEMAVISYENGSVRSIPERTCFIELV